MQRDFDWIFFDCFNTLIDDFDDSGDESGLGSLPDMAVQAGYFTTRADFVSCYFKQRNAAFGIETLFSERLRRTLVASEFTKSSEHVAATTAGMLAHWEPEYDRCLRLAPGAAEAIAYWSTRKPLGVVSNFFLPHYPARYLRRFGLESHFQFILDSAAFGSKKPHSAIFQQGLKLASLDPSQAHRVLFVGDRLELDVTPALSVGMQAIHFNRSVTRPGVPVTPAGLTSINDLAELR